MEAGHGRGRPVLAFLWLMVVVAGGARGCPFYELAPARTNYTTFTDALAAAEVSMLPIMVCDNAQLGENETAPVITTALTIVGEVTGSKKAYFNIENTAAAAAFTLTGDIDVTVRNVQFVFLNTLFLVQDSALLTLERVTMWSGLRAVHLATDGSADSGVFMDHAQFYAVGTAVLIESGPVTCLDCRLAALRDAGFLTRTDFSEVFTRDNQFGDVLLPFALQSAPGADIFTVALSDEFVQDADFMNGRTYPDDCPTTAFGGSGTSGGGGGEGFTTANIILIVLLALAVLGVVITAVAQIVQRKPEVTNTMVIGRRND